MGRVGACADNAAMESFFSLLQKNVLNRRRWATREELRLAILDLDREDLPPPATPRRASADSHPSSSRHSYKPLTRPDHHLPRRVNESLGRPARLRDPADCAA